MTPDEIITEAMRILRARPRRVRTAICPGCNLPVQVSGRGKYCSPRCRQRAWYRRHNPQKVKGANP